MLDMSLDLFRAFSMTDERRRLFLEDENNCTTVYRFLPDLHAREHYPVG